jgi:hypothetical protein
VRKKAFLIAMMLAFAVMFTGMLATEARAIDISFDGFCDGMSFEFSGSTFMVGGVQTGCVSGRIIGNVGVDVGPFFPTPGVGLNICARDQDFGGADFYLINWTQGTWALYRTIGGELPFLLNSGTWSFGAPLSAADLPATGE